MTALNVTYDEPEKRGFLRLNAVALLLTLGAIIFAVLSLGLVVALPALLGSLGLGNAARIAVSVLRWPLLAGAVVIGLAVLYRYAPSRDEPRWSWVSPGAILATVLWIIVSGLFSFYVANFGNYNETYGSIGAVVILLMWFYLTAFIVLVSAALNAEMEHQTAADTTEGASQPMGARSARMADTLGSAAKQPGNWSRCFIGTSIGLMLCQPPKWDRQPRHSTQVLRPVAAVVPEHEKMRVEQGWLGVVAQGLHGGVGDEAARLFDHIGPLPYPTPRSGRGVDRYRPCLPPPDMISRRCPC